VDWRRLHAGRRRRVSLPGYPFERRRYRVSRARPAESAMENKEIAMSQGEASRDAAGARRQGIVRALSEVVQELTGTEAAGIDFDASFFDLGVDSLLLIQATQKIQDRFGVRISLVQLLEETTSLAAIADLLEREAAGLEARDAILHPRGLGPIAVLPEIFAATADAMHFLGEVHGLEPHGEGTDQIARQRRRSIADRGGELEARLRLAVAAPDGRLAVELDQLEELPPALLAQDLPDESPERMHVLTQGLVLRGEMDVAAAHEAVDGISGTSP